MEDNFDLPVTYNGEEQLLPAEFIRTGYSYKIKMIITGTELFFEKDDEGLFRALIDPEKLHQSKIRKEYLQAICETLDQVFGTI